MGSLSSTEITEGMQLEMANGDNTTLSLMTGINGANITLADVMASNGIIHVIDQVSFLQPKKMKILQGMDGIF